MKFNSDTKERFLVSPAEKIEREFITCGYDSNTEQAVHGASHLGLQHLDSSSRMLLHEELEGETTRNKQDYKTQNKL